MAVECLSSCFCRTGVILSLALLALSWHVHLAHVHLVHVHLWSDSRGRNSAAGSPPVAVTTSASGAMAMLACQDFFVPTKSASIPHCKMIENSPKSNPPPWRVPRAPPQLLTWLQRSSLPCAFFDYKYSVHFNVQSTWRFEIQCTGPFNFSSTGHSYLIASLVEASKS